MKSLDEHNRGAKHGKNMSCEDLKLVKKCLAIDLNKVINWDKSGQAMQIHGSGIPYHFKGFNETYWKDIASQRWIQTPNIYFYTSGNGALDITFDIESLALNINDETSSVSDSTSAKYLNALGKDIAMIRKLSFIAHNFYELQMAEKKSSGAILKFPDAYREINSLDDGTSENNNNI